MAAVVLPLALLAAIDADRVTSLPGYNNNKTLPWTMYSGYIETNLPKASGAGKAHTHYVLFLADDVDVVKLPAVPHRHELQESRGEPRRQLRKDLIEHLAPQRALATFAASECTMRP